MNIAEKNAADVARALGHLSYSYQKIQNFDLNRETWSEEELEVLESFASRFARASELIISRLFRSMALRQDPGYRGSVIDILNLAEKEGWISSAQSWVRIRELRNIAAHEYTDEEFSKIYRELKVLCPLILAIQKKI